MKTYLINLHTVFIINEEELDDVLSCISVTYTSKQTGEVSQLPSLVEVKELQSGRVTSIQKEHNS